jgi:hypothetical protein
MKRHHILSIIPPEKMNYKMVGSLFPPTGPRTHDAAGYLLLSIFSKPAVSCCDVLAAGGYACGHTAICARARWPQEKGVYARRHDCERLPLMGGDNHL